MQISFPYSGSVPDALAKALDKPPPSKDETVKSLATEIVIEAVKACSERQIPALVKNLTGSQADAMVKCTRFLFHILDAYRAMELGEECDKFLRFHNAITARYGLGCVTRALVSKRLNG